jgi:hypothetical protein
LEAGRDFRLAAFRAPAFFPVFLAAFRPPDFALLALRAPEALRPEDLDEVFEAFFLAPALGALLPDRGVATDPLALDPPARPAAVEPEPNALRPAVPAAVPPPSPPVDPLEGVLP